MGALRVALGLFTLLVVTLPAFAQQDRLTGTWRFRTAAGVMGRGSICGSGNVSFNTIGGVTGGHLNECNPAIPPATLSGGQVTVDASGNLSGTVDIYGFQGNFLPAGDAFVTVSTVNQSNPTGFGFGVFVKDAATAFSQNDLIGTWRVMLLQGGELPTQISENGFGTIIVTTGGLVTGGAITLFSDEFGSSLTTIRDGQLLVDAEGRIGGTLTTEDGTPFPSAANFSGLMATDKKFVAGEVRTIDGNNLRDVESGLVLLQKEPAPATAFATGDLGGAWTFNQLIFDPSTATTSTWVRGTLNVGPVGQVISSTLVDAFGSLVPVSGGAFTIDGSGVAGVNGIVGAGLLVGGAAVTLEGTMFDNKAHIIGIGILVDPENSETAGVGLFSMAKAAAAEAPSAVVQFSAGAYTVTEGTANAVISVVRSGATTTPFTVPFTASAGTAVPGQDFTPVSGTLTFAAGISSRTFNVPIINNTLVQGNRSVLLALGPPTGNAVLGQLPVAALTILDNDEGGIVKLSSASYSVSENAGSVVVTLLRTGTNLAGNVSVTYATGNGSALSGLDYTATTGTVTFNGGETSKTVRIPILDDTLAEGNETFTFTLSNPTGGATLATPSTAVITIVDNEVVSALKFGSAVYSVNEGAGSVTLTVLRTPSTSSDVRVNFATADGTAISSSPTGLNDFTATTGTLTFGAGNASATIVIPIIQDTRAEGNETFTVVLSNPQGGATLGTPSVATVTIVDDESAIQFSAGSYVGKEGTPAVITLVRSGALGTPATVTFTATPGSASPGLDFTPVSTLVTFTAGLASKTVTVPILNNTLAQGNRTVMLGLNGPTGGAQLGTRGTAMLTLGEDDQGGVVKLSAASYTVAETAGSVVVTVMRVGTGLAGNVSVSYATGNGSALSGLDYTARAGVLTFNAGEISKTVSIPILNDTLVEPDETFTFTLSNPTGGASLGSPVSATITIKSDDAGGQVKFSAAAYSVTEGAGNVSITVVRAGGTASAVTVDYATASGTAAADVDYGRTAGTLSFGAGQTSATIVVPIIQDMLAEGNETFTVTLSNAQGGATLGVPAVATVTIVDDESAIQFSAGSYVGKEGTAAVITLLRSGALGTPATVAFTATAGTATPGLDFTPVSTLVTFAAGLPSKTVTVPILNNTLVQDNRTVMLGLSAPTGGAQLGTRDSAVLSIGEDDQGGVIRLSAASYTVAETAGSVVVTLMRTGTTLAGNVSVSYATGNGSALSGLDYTARVGVLTFNAGEISKTVSIPILNDTVVDPDETFTFTLSAPTGGATLGTPATATITIKDEDLPSQIKLSAASYRVGEGAGNVSITVVRSVAVFREVTVHYATSPTGTRPATPSSDYGAVSGEVTFAPNQTTAFIVVPIVADALTEGDETFLVTLSAPGGGAVLGSPASAVVTIVDDESVVQFSRKFVGNMPEVVRTGPTTTEITVDFFTEDGTATAGEDYTLERGTLTFKAGQSLAYIPLVINPDVVAEGPETFTVHLTNPQPQGSVTIGPVSSQLLTITDNDFGGTVQFGVASLTATPGESKTIPIVRTGGGATILTVNWQAISGGTSEAFSPTSGSVTFSPNETTKSFTIEIGGCDGECSDVTVVFGLSVAPGAATIGATSQLTLTIQGDG